MQKSISIEKTKLFKQQFWVFEKDILNIFEYIAPTNENYSVYWNKIHNLLLSIWAECQNLSQELVLNISGEEWDDFNLISSWECYREYLDLKLSIKSKSIQYIWWLEIWNKLFISPFTSEIDENWDSIWKWWSHYNKLKHKKMDWYNKCCLNDVIFAFWVYYILLQYLIIWYKWTMNCERDSNIFNSKKNIWFESQIFLPTFCYHEQSVNLDLNWYTWIISEWDILAFKSVLQDSDNVIVLPENLDRKNCLYYVTLDIQSFITPNSLRVFREKKLPNIQKTFILQPIFSFSNKRFDGAGWTI